MRFLFAAAAFVAVASGQQTTTHGLSSGTSPTPTTATSVPPNTAPLPTLTGGPYVSFPAPVPYVTPTIPPWGAFWSYSQPPIPATSTTTNQAIFTVAAGSPAAIAQPPQEREYTFNLGYAAGAPNGFHRRMLVINNHFPGPLIEANQGDTIVVHVINGLDTPQSIHWHGMRQNRSNVMDGVPGFSQCPIPPGGQFTYRFKTEGEVGTYWYHSHYGNTLADGLVGGLVIHSKDDPLKLGEQYDDDRVLYLGDWMNDDSEVIIENETNMFKPYRGIPFVSEPDSALINGVGQTRCERAQRGVPCQQNRPAEVHAAAGKRVRLRLINHAGQALIRFSIDGHVLTVIEADDTAVEPVEVHEVPIGAGQRYSVIVTLNQGQPGDQFWIRARVATFCINPLATVNDVGILRYTAADGSGASTADPTSTKWNDLANPNLATCKDLDEDVPLVPLVRENAPSTVGQVAVTNNLFGVFVDEKHHTPFIGFGVNGLKYKNYINNPLLTRVMDGWDVRKLAPFGTEVAAVVFDGEGAADLIINVLDPPPIGHPFHLHGRPFYIVARGSGLATKLTHGLIRKNTINPLRRDTIVIPQWSYAILRVKLDNPGVWPLHCHIGWHLAAGKMAAVVIGSESVREFERPTEWLALCEGLDKGELGPGRRSVKPKARMNATEW